MAEPRDINSLNDNKPHILVVDDEQDILQMVSMCLEQDGFRVSSVMCAEEAYRFMDAHEYNVILTDVMMPGEDGIRLLAKIHERFPDVPVIIMTGFAQLQIAVNAIKNGAFDFIHKPFDFAYLRNVVNKAVEYANLRRMEKNYRAELEEAVACRTKELQNALIQLEASRSSLLKAASDKTNFMTTITHEMRTPMNGVVGALDLLADTGLSGPQWEYLVMARQSADNMLALVDRLLSFSDSVGRGSVLHQEELSLPDLIDSVLLDHRSHFAEKGLSLEARVAPTTPDRIKCDSEQLVRLLDILLGNALKFTEKGGVVLEVFPEQLDGRRAAIRISVKDSGIGIADEMIERIFEPFIQVDGTLTRRFGGAGLGLSIARQIATLLGGDVWAESLLGKGSSFHLRLNAELP